MKCSESVLGIHIDDDFLNVVHLCRLDDSLQVLGCAVEPLETGIVKDGQIIQTKTVAQKISAFIKNEKVKTCKGFSQPSFFRLCGPRAVISLSPSTVRLIPSELPEQTERQLEDHVEDLIGKYAFFGSDDIVFDYCTFQAEDRTFHKQALLQAFTSRQISDACMMVTQQSRLALIGIEPAVWPIVRYVYSRQSFDTDMVSLLLVLDSSSTNISVFKASLPQFCQNLNIGIKDISQEVENFEHLIEKIKLALEFAGTLVGPDYTGCGLTVAVSCGSEELATIVDRIKEALPDVTVGQIDSEQIARRCCIANVTITEDKNLPTFAFACALSAMGIYESDDRHLNLMSQESVGRQTIQKEMSLTAKVIIAVILLSVAALVPLKIKIKSVEAASVDIEMKITETAPTRQRIEDLKKQIEQVNKIQSAYDEAFRKLIDNPWPEVLEIIGELVPDKVRITNVQTTNSGDFTLTGEALAENDVYSFIKKLQDNKLIKNGKVEEIGYGKSNDGTIVNYKIACKIQLPKGDL
jgi:Tfp pilus assembly PilM family ATPase/Tfp pilus assembly protein PilN